MRRRDITLLPGTRGLDTRSKRGLPRLCRTRRLPWVRTGEQREVRNLGWHEWAWAPAHPSPACPRPPGRRCSACCGRRTARWGL